MTSIRALLFALALAAGAAPSLAAPLEAYGKLPTIEDAAISPGGDKLAFIIAADGEERRIVVQDAKTDKVIFGAVVGRSKVRDIRWAGDQHLLVTASQTGIAADVIAPRGEWYMAADLDLTRRKLKVLLQDYPQAMNTIEGLPMVRMVNGSPVVLLTGIYFPGERGVVSLFQPNLDGGATKLLEIGQYATQQYVVGEDGKPVAQEFYDQRSGRWLLRVKTPSGGWRDALERKALQDAPDVLGLGHDGRSVLVTWDKDDKSGWAEVSADTGVLGEIRSAPDGQTAIHDPATGRLIGYYGLEGDRGVYSFIDPQNQKIWKAVEAAFPGDKVELCSWSLDHRKILVRVDSATEGPAFSLVDIDARKASWLGPEYIGVKRDDVSPVKPVRYKAKDGLELSGYLTLPRGRDPKALPLIVFPHGGPASRDTPGFDWWAQAMASRGYAVLQVNFRGSSGYGWDFLSAGFGEWGRKMQTDLSDGVRWLAGQGIVDPKRVCIVGGSYGGYAALAGPTFDRGVYRCAVSFGGISDLRRMINYDRNVSGVASFRYWTRFMGAEDLKDPVLAKYSPALHAADADAPILLIHGKDDTVVPLDQSTEMADALKTAGKPVELIVQNHADHWLSLGDTRLQMLQATMAFVEKHNPPQ